MMHNTMRLQEHSFGAMAEPDMNKNHSVALTPILVKGKQANRM